MQNCNYYWLISIVLFSCSRIEDHSIDSSLYRPDVEGTLTNNKIDSLIQAYVIHYDVSPYHRLILLEYYSDPVRKYYYISQAARADVVEGGPDYYFIHRDEFLVLLFVGRNNFFDISGIAEKINAAIKRRGISLSSDTLDYNPPVWEITEDCTGKFAFRDKSDFISDFLPCGYRVKQDSVNFDNFYIVKK